MLISLSWIRDYVDLPADLDPRALGEKFTRIAAEIEGVSRVDIGARGLIAARVISLTELPGAQHVRAVGLDIGHEKTVEVVSGAPVLHFGQCVVFAPPGAFVNTLGKINATKVAGRASDGMILPGDACGIALAAREAVFLDPSVAAGQPLDSALFDDWLIEIDNKSITNRPDLWGHYGVAREIAAIVGAKLKPLSVAPLDALSSGSAHEVPIRIADPRACRRYSALVLEGVPAQPAPLWMQLRLGRVGMRPITGLVDLTNYIMADIGQPMHAFDASKVDRIEVDWAKPEEVFCTLDGVERELDRETLMIQSHGRSIALAGIMGGLETEVSPSTTKLFLESGNFDPTTVRKAAARLGLRTDASARFEKSLDPLNTVLGIQRFVDVAGKMYPKLRIASRLCDAYPAPLKPVVVEVKPRHVARTIGRDVVAKDAEALLAPLGFQVSGDATAWNVKVPSHRATNDISIEADVIEELARRIGYDSIAPAMPRVSMRRFTPNPMHAIEKNCLEYFTSVHGFNEVFGYLWHESPWLARLGYDPGPSLTLRNPAAEGCERLRRTLMPGLLASLATNRFHFPAVSILEVGSVFEPNTAGDCEFRHAGLVLAYRGKKIEDELFARLKGAVEGWGRLRFGRSFTFMPVVADAHRPWEDRHRTCAIALDGATVGRLGVVDLATRRAMDEHLGAWGVVWAELRLNDLAEAARTIEPLGKIPEFPRVETDFSLVAKRSVRYREVAERLQDFKHPLLRQIRFVGSYEGEQVGAGLRSFTFRAIVGDDSRTLTELDTNGFREAFERHLHECGFEIRK